MLPNQFGAFFATLKYVIMSGVKTVLSDVVYREISWPNVAKSAIQFAVYPNKRKLKRS